VEMFVCSKELLSYAVQGATSLTSHA
jgi:hypothetical protein